MKKAFLATPVALAVAAVFSSAYAGGDRRGPDPHDVDLRVDVDNHADIDLDTKQSIHNDFRVLGLGLALGLIRFNAESSAIVDTKQISGANSVTNDIVDNDATLDGDAMRNARGNIGANVAAGDNNQQANDGALAAVDARFVFASAQAYSVQKSTFNSTFNFATHNNARLAGNALAGASGNIGANVAAGNGNQQANLLAASVNNSGTVAKASSFGLQDAGHNQTFNIGLLTLFPVTTQITLTGSLNGQYQGTGAGSYAGQASGSTTGQSWQMSNIYPDAWAVCAPGSAGCNTTDPNHPTNGPRTGHIDIDNQTQGAVQNPLRPGIGGLAFDNRGNYSGTENGSLNFSEAGSVSLAGSFTGFVVTFVPVFRPHLNNALLAGSALAGASGNIGVNVAAGTNNMQRNSLAIATARGAAGGILE
jgi:hypothetical protein